MKKSTKVMMSGILILSILFGMPVSMESAEATGQNAAGGKQMAGFRWDLLPHYPDWGEELEIISEIHTETTSDDTSEVQSEVLSEAEPESVSEKMSEIESEIESEKISEIELENLSESTSEICSEVISEERSEEYPEFILEETTDENSETESRVDYHGAAGEMTVIDIPAVYVAPEISDDGELDYRTYMDKSAELRIALRKTEPVQIVPYSAENGIDGGTNPDPGGNDGEVSAKELENVSYQIRIDNVNIVDFGEVEGASRRKKSSVLLTTRENCIPLKINSVGETKYTIKVSGLPDYDINTYSGCIRVNNSPLYDSDFYIELSKDEQTEQYEYNEWIAYLENCHKWVNAKIDVKLTDTGKTYFSSIGMETHGVLEFPRRAADRASKTYTFWAENPDRNASTKNAGNGTRSFTAGIDSEAPVLKSFSMESQYYEPTKTDTEQYFAEEFILTGAFGDDVSGVSRIEYTTDLQMGQDAVWTEAETMQCPETREWINPMTGFRIVLSDGTYPAIAVRAYDEAGNVSAVKGYVNENGEHIKVVVDRMEPALTIDVTSDGRAYSGENDNWTNSDVRFDIALDKESCPYAGLYQCEYAYVKIGEDMTDMSGKWTELSMQEAAAGLIVTEDKNGYFLFRAVSRSGVAIKENVKQRILIQHQAAEIKPLVIGGADETKCQNGWYNKQSGTPLIRFEYPDYDTGVISKEYDAPVTVHYKLTKTASVSEGVEEGENAQKETVAVERNALIGVMSSENATVRADGSKEFVLTKDNLDQHVIRFGYDDGDKETLEVQDGIYTLEYWTTDKAGNESGKQIYHYKIDCHEPTELTMELGGLAFAVGEEPVITYESFYRETISGSADAQYGISGKGSLKVLKARKIGEWNGIDSSSLEDADEISIAPNTRCFLYIRAEDHAGNVAEGWTNGIVVDNMAPNEGSGGINKELIIEPEGANEHGFFNGDITVDINVKDAPEDNNCAALRTVSGSIGRDGVDTVADRELFSFLKESPSEDELIEAAGFQGRLVIDAEANESNEAYVEVTAVDRSDNRKTSVQQLKIDVTRPEIDISFDNNDAVNGSYYRQKRVATIHVHELNFDADAVSVSVTKNGQPYEMPLSGWTSDGKDHYAEIVFSEDGDYHIKAECIDLADNASEPVQSEPFTIDCTAPEIAIDLIAGGEAQMSDKDCFNTDITAVITVTEHNFRAEDFVINMSPASEKGTWSHEGDVHTLRVPFAGDNLYHIDCAYADRAGNPANTVARDFIIDTTAPVIAIGGVADGSANSGAILPVISVLDQNIEISDITVSVTTGIGDVVEYAVESELIDDENAAVCRLTLTDLTDKPDNVYHLTVSASDRAGNETEITYRFSLNRNGSVYDLSALLQLMDIQYNTYSGLSEIQIVEMNIDTVEEFELYVSRNGAIGYPAEYTKQMSGSADRGYTYIYNIKKENFAGEGTYRLSLYSRDRAGNEVNNASDIHGNEISFVIDNTAPKVVIDGVASGMVYDVESQAVHVSVTDNFKLAEAELTLVNRENEILQRWDYMALSGEKGELVINIPQYNEEVSLLYRVSDAAGNEMETFQGEQTALVDFLVTTDRFVQFVNKPSKTPFGRMILFMTALSAVSILYIVTKIIRRRKRKHL